MSGSMMMHSQMMKDQNETKALVDQLMKNFAAIEAEKDPTALKSKLAEHGALLKELQTKVQARSQMMDQMTEMMHKEGAAKGGPMGGQMMKKQSTGSTDKK